MRIFKYFHPDRTDVLRDRRISFSSPASLNDPFEMRPTLQLYESDQALRARAEEMMERLVNEVESQLPAKVRKKMTPVERLRIRNQVLKMLPDTVAVHLPAIREKFYKGMDSGVGILCLTERQDDILMWAHYAYSHEGFVVEFDPSSPFFNQRRGEGDEFRHLKKVIYSAQRPNMILSNTTNMSALLTKSEHWSYEREWRMLMALSEASTTIKAGDRNICLFDFPEEAILSVTLGCRMSEKKSMEIKGILAGSSYLSGIPVYKTAPDDTLFMLNINPA